MLLKERVADYLKNAKPNFENLRLKRNDDKAKKFFQMAKSYYQDACYYFKKKKYVEALACLEYAEGWLDAGIVAGYLEIR